MPCCPFCYDNIKDRVVAEQNSVVAIQDNYPVTDGHLLIVPKRHMEDYFSIFVTLKRCSAQNIHLTPSRNKRMMKIDTNKNQQQIIGSAAKRKSVMKRKTNFDGYLDDQLKDPKFAERFQKAGEAWDIALQIASLRNEAGMSQTELAKKAGTTQHINCYLFNKRI